MCNCNQQYKLIQEIDSELNDGFNPSFESGEIYNQSNIRPVNLKSSLQSRGQSNIKMIPNSTFGYIFDIPKTSLSREQNEIESEVYDPDRRKAIVNTLNSPYRWVCRLELNFNGRMAIGTGTLISPRHVLTCGHNLFNNKIWPGAAREATEIKVTPGYNCAGKTAAPFGFTYKLKVNYHENWKTHLDPQYDYGLITLSSEIGKKRLSILGDKPLGYWGDKVNGGNTRIIPQTTEVLKDKPFNISGYPGDKCCYRQLDRNSPALLEDCKKIISPRFKGDPFQMWGGAQFSSFGKVTDQSPHAHPRLILYDLDTWGGHSGSPLWIRWQHYRNLIAIHTGPYPPSNNRGIRITEEVMQKIRSWM